MHSPAQPPQSYKDVTKFAWRKMPSGVIEFSFREPDYALTRIVVLPWRIAQVAYTKGDIDPGKKAFTFELTFREADGSTVQIAGTDASDAPEGSDTQGAYFGIVEAMPAAPR